MRKIFFIVSCSSVLGGLLACDDAFRGEDSPDRPDRPGRNAPREEAQAEAALAEAREAEADVYAPAFYGAAVEALEKGDASDGTPAANEGTSAEILARRAVDEAVRTREEAKQAAHASIRDASVLFSVVEAVLSHDPPDRGAIPSDARLEELRAELARAVEAYGAGDYATAGHIAQTVSKHLADF